MTWPIRDRVLLAVRVAALRSGLALGLALWIGLSPVLAGAADSPGQGAAVDSPPAVGGVVLRAAAIADWRLFHDPDVGPAAVGVVAGAVERARADVPRLTGLPPFSTPITLYLLVDDGRLRRALAEIGRVRVDLLGQDIGAYTIEREGTMLVFLSAALVREEEVALATAVHELTHLAVREATARRPVPQWFNEGYATWTEVAAQRERYPEDGAVFERSLRALVASAMLGGGGLLPWGDLTTRARFAQAGREGHGTLAYAQSTLFVDWLARRHGRGALAEFLVAIGRGVPPAQAFPSALGPFAPRAEAFADEVAKLPVEYGRGLHRLTHQPAPGRRVLFALVGGVPGEPAGVELIPPAGGARRYERWLDAAGFLPVPLGRGETASAGRWLVRVTTASLGSLEAEVVIGSPDEQPARSSPPVQLPRRAGAATRPDLPALRLASAA